MKQLIQNLKNGQTILEEVPAPEVRSGSLLIRTSHSLVSLGTERMLVEFGKANLIQKARQQPEKVKQVLDKVRTEGLIPTLEAVFNKLEQPIPLGYCNVGEVIAIGKGVTDFKVGDRVASNGNHAEFVCVPQNLVAHIPENVTDQEAAFTVIGSIGLQGIRLLNPTFGETIVVIGLGLIGLITAEILKSNGCRVIGFDYDEQKVQIAKSKGIIAINPASGIDTVKFVEETTQGIGADGVIITASNKSDEIISQAAKMSRKRGRIVLVGVIGLHINRSDFYEKELSFQVSCSYGPGRYDENYEQVGNDYPLPFVRWTEKRNFQAILQAMSSEQIDVKPYISKIVDLEDYGKIYNDLGNKQTIASILKYPIESKYSTSLRVSNRSFTQTKGIIGIIGAGNFTKMTMLPAMKSANADIKFIASASGVSGTALAKKYNIEYSTTDYKEIINDNEVDLVLITTRHNQHAKLTIEALNAGKNVFVEKPLTINEEDVEGIVTAYQKANKTLIVGFNRRFSPHIQKMKSLVGNSPMNIIATMNAGFIPTNSWVHDLNVGGGRIVGEACHFIDLITFLTGSRVKNVCMNSLGTNENTDNASILLKYENGSTGVINYFANGSKAYSKERIELYSQERTLILDNFQTLKGYGFKNFSNLKTSLDKGHKKQFELLIDRIKNGGEALIPFDEIINTTKASFAAIESLKKQSWIEIK
ncbi:bi-domain-containing oxidoreductase [Emticicia sp.]|uniref:bi-domain-containing oxidoreductase n=1 Tax=Emticicia sp. TaxID=1930953 RepID=UPI003753AA7D